MSDQAANEAAYSAGYAQQERAEFVARNAHRLEGLTSESVAVRSTRRGDTDDDRVAAAVSYAARKATALFEEREILPAPDEDDDDRMNCGVCGVSLLISNPDCDVHRE